MSMPRHNKQLDQNGFASIIVTMIIIVFVTLVAVGFAYLARQNQVQTENSSLNTQAFYAAESGVNEAVKQLPGFTTDVTKCNDPRLIDGTTNVLNTSGPVEYTCVFVTRQPTDLQYSSISTEGSTLVHIRTANGDPVSNLLLSWQGSADGNGLPPTFAASSSNFYLPMTVFTNGSKTNSPYVADTANFPKTTGILRASILTSGAIAGARSVDDILAAQQDVFLYPRASAGSANQFGTIGFRGGGNPLQQGVFGDGKCNTGSAPLSCNVVISGINSNDFYVRLRSIYHNVAVNIRAFNGAISSSDQGGSLAIQGAQAQIDATGRAVDTVRRISVRVPLGDSYLTTEFALEAGTTICKSFSAAPGLAGVIQPDFQSDNNPYLGTGNGTDDTGVTGTPGNYLPYDETACQLSNELKPTFSY